MFLPRVKLSLFFFLSFQVLRQLRGLFWVSNVDYVLDKLNTVCVAVAVERSAIPDVGGFSLCAPQTLLKMLLIWFCFIDWTGVKIFKIPPRTVYFSSKVTPNETFRGLQRNL